MNSLTANTVDISAAGRRKIENLALMANKILRKTRLKFLSADLWHHYATLVLRESERYRGVHFYFIVFKKPFNASVDI